MARRFQNVERVLFVDDDRDVLDALVRDFSPWLHTEQLAYDAVDSGAECLRVLEETYPQTGLVVSDLRMPGMGGAELFEQINRRYSDVGCVLVTAYSDMEQINRAVAASMLGLIQKPWDAASLTREISGAVASIDAMRTTRDRNRQLAEQMELAAAFQRAYMEIVPPADDRIRIDVLSRPAPGMHLTGDYHDVVRISPDRFLIVVADGAGTGVRPALLTAMMKILVRQGPGSPKDVLAAFNRRLIAVLPRGTDLLISCVTAEVDLREGTITTARAGHNSVFLVGDRVMEAAAPTGPALGFDPEATYEERTFSLQAETRIVLFTDGLYDRSPRGAESALVRSRGIEDLFRHAHGNPSFIDEVVRLVTADRILNGLPVVPLFDDDVTLLSFYVRGIGPQ